MQARTEDRSGGRRMVVAAAALLLTLTGCMTPGIDDPARLGPFHIALNHTGEAQLPASLRRIVLLPVAGGTVAPAESAAALDAVFLIELQKQNRFEIVTVNRADCLRRFHAEEFLSTTALPHDFAETLRREYGADGVMFVDLTAFVAYRPLVLGVRAKLAGFGADAHILWAFDNIFAASDSAVANAARNHYLQSERSGVPADFTQAVLQSPSRFAAYVAAEMFETLPPVYSARPAPTK